MAEEGNNGGRQVGINVYGEEKSKGPKGNEPAANKPPKSPLAGDDSAKKQIIKNVIELVVFLLLIGCLVASLTIGEQKNILLWGLEIWKWCVLVMVIFGGMLVNRWFTHLVLFLIHAIFKNLEEVLYYVHGLKKSVQVLIWLSIVLATWVILFLDVKRSKTATKVVHYVTWTLATMVIGSFLWLLKTFLLKAMALKFHRSKFFEKIRESLFHQYILRALSEPPPIMQNDGMQKPPPMLIASNEKKGKESKTKREVDIGKVRRLKREKVSAWSMKLWVGVIRNSRLSTISYPLEGRACDEDGEEADITTEVEAMYVAHEIFARILGHDCNHDRSYIDGDDLSRFMIKEDVNRVFPLFEGASSTGKIDESSFTNWVIKVYQERKTLVHALDYNKRSIKELNILLMSFVIVTTFIIWLLLVGIAPIKVLLLLSSQLVAAAFIFGNTCKTVFEGIMFVFVMHPFDVGDRCEVDGVPLLVEEMNILTTVFLKPDNEKVFYPNSVLASKPIGNYYRSPDMGDTIEFSIDFMTPVETIGRLKEEINKYMVANTFRWHPNHFVAVKEIENVNKLKMVLYCKHKMNFQDSREKNRRRTDLIIELHRIFGQLGIRHKLLPQQVNLNQVSPDHSPDSTSATT